MKTYLEAEELVKDMTTVPESIRVDVTDKTSTEIEAIKTDIKDVMAGLTYRLSRHTCGHNEGKKCSWQEVTHG